VGIKVEAILDTQGLWEAVSPSGDAAMDVPKNKVARAQLLQALMEDILMQVSTKKTTNEVWESLKTRFIGANRVKTAHLAMLKEEFDKLCMVTATRWTTMPGRSAARARSSPVSGPRSTTSPW
jgi:hypothetical protein